MITGPTQLPSYLADDATFRTWAQGIHDALVACGMVQTSDTGQINLATVARPAVVSNYAGYEIWRFNDALQAQSPIFFKIEYGVGTTVDRPALAIQFGQGSNGSGTLTGTTSLRKTFSTAASKTAGATLPLYASAAAGRLWLMENADFGSSTFGTLIGCERTCDESGNPTADGFVWFGHFSSSHYWQTIPRTGSAGIEQSGWPVFEPSIGKGVVGTDIAFAPVLTYLGKPFYMKALVAQNTGDIAGNTTFTANYLGAVRTYLAMLGAINPAFNRSGAGNSVMCLPWE